MRHATLATSVLAVSAFSGMSATAAIQHVSALGATSGWYSDDTRNTSGVTLVGTNSSYAPGGTNAGDVAIAQQIYFTDTGTSTTNGDGVLVLDGTTDNRGKSSVKFFNTTTGLGSGASLASFTASYRWFMDSYTTSRTPALSLVVNGTNGLNYSLAYVSSPVSNSTPQAWNLSTVDANTTTSQLGTAGVDGWFLYSNGAPGGTVAGRSLNQILADATYGSILSGGTVVATGFNIGSSQRNCRVGIDWVENSLLNGGDRIDFGVAIPAPGALALLGVAGLAGGRRRRA